MQNKTDPPQPLDQNVTIVSGFQGVFAVISYGGVAEDMIIKSLASSLSQNLTSDGFEYDKTILSVIYDDPIKLRDRWAMQTFCRSLLLPRLSLSQSGAMIFNLTIGMDRCDYCVLQSLQADVSWLQKAR